MFQAGENYGRMNANDKGKAVCMERERYENLKQYLPGLLPQMGEPWEKLAEIFQFQVFELCQEKGKEEEKIYYVPYLMNDAVECCLRFSGCRMTGAYLPDFQGEVKGELMYEREKTALVIRQEENVSVLWFAELEMLLQEYQYHQIGHFWVKGQEQWRQLVYMAGIVYDKYEFLGENRLNEKEKELTALMEFAPFRRWSPVRDSLEERYPATRRGTEYMEKLARLSNDGFYAGLVRLYRLLPCSFLEKILHNLLKSSKREVLYRRIRQEFCDASIFYPERDYGENTNQQIRKMRTEAERQLQKAGFEGTYPLFFGKGVQVLAVEEHPFTRLEAEDFSFRIQYMVSRGKISGKGLNSGFFKGKQRAGSIEKNLDFLAFGKKE